MRMALRVLPEPVVPAGAASRAAARDDVSAGRAVGDDVDRTAEG
jgi:hypothetical protein